MTRKLVVLAALIWMALPVAFAQTTATLPATSSVDASAPVKIGGDVLPPVLISSVKPELHRSLFHAPKSNVVLVGLTVPPDGIPTDIHIVHSGGAILDKAALDAIAQYRFRSATQNGNPVAVTLNIEVKFKIY